MFTEADLPDRRLYRLSQLTIKAAKAELFHQMVALTSSPPREVSPEVLGTAQEQQQEQDPESPIPSLTQLSSPLFMDQLDRKGGWWGIKSTDSNVGSRR